MHYLYKQIDGITGEELDEYLASGWFRLRQELISVFDRLNCYFWLRTIVNKVELQKTQQRVFRKAIKFHVEIINCTVTQEIEELWAHYKGFIDFEVARTVAMNIYDSEMHNQFNTKLVTVRDNEKLIAVGYFDVGKNSIASILHFYHQEYKKYSLGKYLLLIEMEYAIKNGINYYYTGYINTLNSKYDYKLFCGKDAIEFYMKNEKKWIPWNSFKSDFI